MKKLTSLFVILALLMLCACGSKTGATADGAAADGATGRAPTCWGTMWRSPTRWMRDMPCDGLCRRACARRHFCADCQQSSCE